MEIPSANCAKTQKAHKKAHNFRKMRLKTADAPQERVYLMAAIRENKKNGKIVSYRFTTCLERDARGKQIRRYTTWTPPEGLTPSKAKKAAERAVQVVMHAKEGAQI